MNFITHLVNPMQYCEKTVLHLTKSLNIDVVQSTVQKDLLEHPDYPSLLSISDVLKNYGIDNVALKMSRENFQKLDTPFIAHISGKKTGHDLFGIVSSIKDNSLALYNPDINKTEIVSYDDFDKIYIGTVLAVEASEHAGEKDFEKKLKAEKRKGFLNLLIAFAVPILVVLSISMSILNYGFQQTIFPSVFTLLTLIGYVIGVLLLWHEVDKYNPTIKEICHAGKKVNCSAILNSNAAKVFGMSWSVLGSTYFIGMLLALLIGGIMNTANLFLLSWINIIALPYIIYSISYQYFVAKQWCVLCLAVQAVLFLQFITALSGGFPQFHQLSEILPQTYLTIATCFGVVFIALLLLIPALEKAKDSRNKTIALQRLKHNPQIFEALLAKQKKIERSTEGLGITLGNPNAKYKLVKVCNPYCGPCASAHPIMEELLENNEDLQIQIIFTATNKEDDYRAKPVKHLLAITAQGDEELTKQALDDWYNAPVKDYDAFANKYSQYSQHHSCHGEHDEPQKGVGAGETALKQMSDWCEETKIAFTPTFFVNGRQLPEIYSVADLKYFLQN